MYSSTSNHSPRQYAYRFTIMCCHVFHFPSYITSYVTGSFFSIHLVMFCHQFWSMICTLISFIFMSSRLPSESCSLSLHHVCLSSSIDIWYGMILWIYVMPNISFAINSVILHISIWFYLHELSQKKTYTSCSMCSVRLRVAWYQTQSASFFMSIASPFAQGGRESPEAISCRPSWAPRSGRGV